MIKHIPIEIWSEIKKHDLISDIFRHGYLNQIRNQGGKTYIVTTQRVRSYNL